jgi:hypothetical protein
LTKDIEERKKLTFAQAEGIEPLPSQLKLREVSPKLRAALWKFIHDHLQDHTLRGDIDTPWSTILKEVHVYHRHRMADDFSNRASILIQETRSLFESGDYAKIFGWLESVLKHPSCPIDFPEELEGILRYGQAAYRVIDEKVICPIASDTEHSTIVQAFANLAAKQFNGARAHLRNAASYLTSWAYAEACEKAFMLWKQWAAVSIQQPTFYPRLSASWNKKSRSIQR